MAADVTYSDQRSMVVFTPHTSVAEQWLSDNTDAQPWQWLGSSLCVDVRYAFPILQGLQDEGFTLEAA